MADVGTRLLFCLCLLLTEGTVLRAEQEKIVLPESDLLTNERSHFLVVGKDFEAVQFVSGVGDAMAALASKYMQVPPQFAPSVVAFLIDIEGIKDAPPYFIKKEATGEVEVRIRWNTDTRFSDLCEAMARGFLRKWVYHTHGANALANVPPWLELAFARELEAKLRPQMRQAYRERAENYPKFTIEEIIADDAAEKLDRDELATHSYWLFRVIRGEIGGAKAFYSFMTSILTSGDSFGLMKEAFTKEGEEWNPSLWWPVTLQAQVHGRATAIRTLQDSRELLLRLSVLTAHRKGGDRPVPIENLWPYRKDESFNVGLKWTLREIKTELAQINPVYYNALLSLGQAYEALTQDKEEVYDESVAVYRRDFLEAVWLQSEIESFMSDEKRKR